MDPLSAKDMFTISCAVLGAVLGVINTWHGLNQRRVKLKVVPMVAYPIVYGRKFDQEMGCVDVTNLSTFPVTLREVGFTNGDPRKKERAICLIGASIVRECTDSVTTWCSVLYTGITGRQTAIATEQEIT